MKIDTNVSPAQIILLSLDNVSTTHRKKRSVLSCKTTAEDVNYFKILIRMYYQHHFLTKPINYIRYYKTILFCKRSFIVFISNDKMFGFNIEGSLYAGT